MGMGLSHGWRHGFKGEQVRSSSGCYGLFRPTWTKKGTGRAYKVESGECMGIGF